MNGVNGNGGTTWWRNRRLWLALWLIGTVVFAGILLWDARSWLQGAPHATFRATKLNQWPLESLWWLFIPAILLVQKSLTRVDRH